MKRAFTLIEVMVACGIFFMAAFSILALVSGSLRNARAIQQHQDVDVGMVGAWISQQLKTNKLSDISLQGDCGFGSSDNAYPDYSWEAEVNEYMTNGLLEVNIPLNKRGNRGPLDNISILVYAPDAQKSRLGMPNMR